MIQLGSLWLLTMFLSWWAARHPRLHAIAAALNIEVVAFMGCPHLPRTKTNLEAAVQFSGIPAKIALVDRAALSNDDPRLHWPSPTILVEGRDLFGMAEPQQPAHGCRWYVHGTPSTDEIASALRTFSA